MGALRRTLGLLLVVGIVAGATLSAYRALTTTTDVYTGADAISVPVGSADPRGVLWTPPKAEVATEADEHDARVSADGSSLFFVQPGARGDADIFVRPREGDAWGEARALSFCTGADDLSPTPLADGLLIFASDRAGGRGGYDLWLVRPEGGAWGVPVNLDDSDFAGTTINTVHDEYGASVSPDSINLMFVSNRPAGEAQEGDTFEAEAGDYDVYNLTLGSDEVPTRVQDLSSESNDGPAVFSPGGDFVYFASDRPGGVGASDLYRVRVTPDGLGTIEPLHGLNTEANELSPWLDMDGFRVRFSSDRADGFDTYIATSREVYRDRNTSWADIDWAGLWRALWPWLTSLIAVLLLLWILSRIAATGGWGKRWRRLSLLAKCVILSLIAHALLLLILAGVHVTSSIGELLNKPSGAKVRLVTHAGGSTLGEQLRGRVAEFTVEPDAAPDAQQMEAPSTPQTQFEAVSSAATPMRVTTSAPSERAALNDASASGSKSPDLVRPPEQSSSPEVSRPDDPARVASGESRAPRTEVARGSEQAAQLVIDARGPQRTATEFGGMQVAPSGTAGTNASIPDASGYAGAAPDLAQPDQSAAQENVTVPVERTGVATDEASQAAPSLDEPTPDAAPVAAAQSETPDARPGVDALGLDAPRASTVESDAADAESSSQVVPDLTAAQSWTAEAEITTPDTGAPVVADAEPTDAPTEIAEARDTRASGTTTSDTDSIVTTDTDAARAQINEEAMPGISRSTSDAEAQSRSPVTPGQVPRAVARDVNAALPAGAQRADNTDEAQQTIAPLAANESRADLAESADIQSKRVEDLAPAENTIADATSQTDRAVAESNAPRLARSTPKLRQADDAPSDDAPVALPTDRRAEAEESDTEQELFAIRDAASARPDTVPTPPSFDRASIDAETAAFSASRTESQTDSAEANAARPRNIAIASPEPAALDAEITLPMIDMPVGDATPRADDVPDAPPTRLTKTPEAPASADQLGGDTLEPEFTAPGTLDLRDSDAPRITSRDANAARALLLPEADAPRLEIPGLELTLPDPIAPAPDQIGGVVLEAMSRRPIEGAVVRLDGDEVVEVQSDARGRFAIVPNRMPDFAALTATADGYRPAALNISSEQVGSDTRVVFLLEPVTTSVIVLEEDPVVHHLGDDRFDGPINSQFQKSSEGTSYEKTFTIDDDQAQGVRRVRLSLLYKGAQIDNQIRVNGRLLRKRLTGSPADGSFGEFTTDIPIPMLKRGENTIEIRSVINRGTDHDDFEFVNVQIELVRAKRQTGL